MPDRAPEAGRRLRALVLGAVAAVAAGAPAVGQSVGGDGQVRPPLAVELRADRVGFTVPREASVRLTRPAHVAVFEVRPGIGSVLRYPDARRGGRLSAGTHRLSLRGAEDAFGRRRGVSPLPGRGRLSPDRPRGLGRPYLLVVASRDRLWLSGHRLGNVFRPRDVRLSVPFLVDAVLRDVIQHPQMQAWAFDVRPGVPLLGPRRYGVPLPGPRRYGAPPPLAPVPRRDRAGRGGDAPDSP